MSATGGQRASRKLSQAERQIIFTSGIKNVAMIFSSRDFYATFLEKWQKEKY